MRWASACGGEGIAAKRGATHHTIPSTPRLQKSLVACMSPACTPPPRAPSSPAACMRPTSHTAPHTAAARHHSPITAAGIGRPWGRQRRREAWGWGGGGPLRGVLTMHPAVDPLRPPHPHQSSGYCSAQLSVRDSPSTQQVLRAPAHGIPAVSGSCCCSSAARGRVGADEGAISPRISYLNVYRGPCPRISRPASSACPCCAGLMSCFRADCLLREEGKAYAHGTPVLFGMYGGSQDVPADSRACR
jgi:hypothetical protein